MLKLKNITKVYDAGQLQVHALKGVSLEFRNNEFVSILGPSGCGKTTLLNIIGGLDKYTSGDLVINNVSTVKYKDRDWDTYRNHSIGFVFQSYNLIPHQTILQNVEISLTLSGVSKKERKQKAIDALIKVGLEDQIYKRPNQLSGGQMQRVAIARAIVNNPDIILADEPTGALDSETSIQVMDILKELSKETLVIMVTHNPELAKQYSTRIINLFDGLITGDTNPYHTEEVVVEQEEAPKKEKYTAMKLLTAFALSINNLLTKKTRTLLTTFAGSIGIIGITLVMALSNGFQTYIDKLQVDTLSSYPLIVSSTKVDLESMMNYVPEGLEKFPAIEKLYINEIMAQIQDVYSVNEITQEYLDDVIYQIPEDLLVDVSYTYDMDLEIYKESAYLDNNNQPVPAALNISKLDDMIESMTSMLGSLSSSFKPFSQLLGNEDFLKSQYDLIYGSYPASNRDVVLVVDQYNQVTDVMLNCLGLDSSIIVTEENGKKSIDFSKIIGTKYKVLTNNQLYQYDEAKKYYTTTEFKQNSLSYVSMDEFNESNIELTISGVIRLNENSTTGQMGQMSIVGYLPSLTEEIFSINAESDIVIAQKANDTINMLTGSLFSNSRGVTYTSVMKQIGGLKLPNGINIYPKDFNAKEKVKEFLNSKNKIYHDNAVNEYYYELGEKYLTTNPLPDGLTDQEAREYIINLGMNNATKTHKEEAEKAGRNAEIQYTDIMSLMISAVGDIINGISAVLIAFTSISLIVSSIMIGIITYISVIERTKEIGVLRAVGARKKDISRVFNAETFVIGLAAGLFGVLVTTLLCIPINAVLFNLMNVKNMAFLNPAHAIIVVIISFMLTMISGLIPSRMASKQDPVIALRSE